MNSVILIEDNCSYRETVQGYVDSCNDFFVLNAYESFDAAWSEISEEYEPDIILMDIDLPGTNGIEGSAIIKRTFPKIDIIMLTVYDNNEKLFAALKVGACGYLNKNVSAEQLCRALGQVKKGGAPMSNNIARMVVDSFKINYNNPLSEREREVLLLLSQGKTYSSIALELFVAKTTVRAHIRNIYEKLHVNSKEEAIKKAIKDKLV
jgi:DNA-binding NarL/FixJ family response regulator